MMTRQSCRILDWDSEFFNARIARVADDHLTPDSLNKVLEWCGEQNVDCLYFLCQPDDDESVLLAEKCGFHLVDIRVELNCRALDKKVGTLINTRAFRESDLTELRDIASDAYTDSRFYFDSGFSMEKSSALYREWIANSCRGYADEVLIAPWKNRLGGFITCHLESKDLGRIGLVAVSAEARGAGIGDNLIKASHNYFRDQGVVEIRVVTQGRNVAAQRLYQANGFRTFSVNLWYHKWFN